MATASRFYGHPFESFGAFVWFLTWDTAADAHEFAATLKTWQPKAHGPMAKARVKVVDRDVLVLGLAAFARIAESDHLKVEHAAFDRVVRNDARR